MAVSSIIRVERDPSFWRGVLGHPSVSGALRGLDVSAGIDAVLGNQTVIPIASENGGYLFVRMDFHGRVWDLHAAYTSEGRGREAHDALAQALDAISFDVIIVGETDDPASRPPKSFGFRQAGEAADSALGPLTTWILTREAWEASKARARMH